MAAFPIALCFLFACIAWMVFSTIRRVQVAKLQTALQGKLLDRIDSTDAILAYVSTEAGRKLTDALRLDQEDRAAPFRSILMGVQACSVLVVFGGALLVLHGMRLLPDSRAEIWGLLTVALGAGFGIAAAATFVLSRSFGLLADNRRQ